MALCMSVAPNCLQRTYTRRDLVLLLGDFGLPCLAGSIQLKVVSQCKANFRLQLTHHHPHHTSSKCPHGFWTIAQLQSPHMPAATATRHVVTM